jgi:transposase
MTEHHHPMPPLRAVVPRRAPRQRPGLLPSEGSELGGGLERLRIVLASWRTEILARHSTGASNGPTEGLNLCVKKVKRAGHGFRRFDNYRLRVLLHTGGITWPERPSPPRIRTRQSPLR